MDNSNTDTSQILNFELFFDLTHDLLCIAGFDGYFKRVSPAVCKVVGYTPAELMSSPIHQFIHPDDRLTTAQHRSKLLDNVPLLNFENRYLTKTGEIVWLSWTSIPVEKDKVVYAIAKNITHKKEQEADRNRIISNLTKINHDLKLLTYSTSHDLRTPVNNLLAVFELLDVSKIEDEETLDFIDILKSATGTLKDTLNDYVSTLNSKDSFSVHVEDLDLGESLSRVMLALKSLLASSGALIDFDFSKAAEVSFNKTYLDSIFLNLISNSIKYAFPNQYGQIAIYLKAESQSTYTLTVHDDGIGLPTDFEERRKKSFGLQLVSSLAKKLGGTIEFQNNNGTKAILYFVLAS